MACEDEMAQINPPPPEEIEIFDLQWATRVDINKEIVGTDYTQQYNEWVLVGGDIGDPPTIRAFNKNTGVMDWEYIHEGSFNSEIDESKIVDNIYLGVCSDGIVAVDMQNMGNRFRII